MNYLHIMGLIFAVSVLSLATYFLGYAKGWLDRHGSKSGYPPFDP